MAAIEQRLSDRGLRVTPQRVAIYEFLSGNRTHPTAADIHDAVKRQYPMISPATIYKTLEVLVQMGEVVELPFPDGTNRYDSNAHPHVHLVCTRCQTILDVEDGALLSLEMRAADASGFAIFARRFELQGLCRDCRTAESELKGPPA